MKPKRILVIQGHPDAAGGHFCHALADAYASAAREAGHAVETVDVARLDFPLLRSKDDWDHGALPPGLVDAQRALLRAGHLVFVFPLWLGGMPALLKGFLEQIARPALAPPGEGMAGFRKMLAGRSARIVVTMGMPAIVYRFVFRAHSIRALERSILGFVGVGPIHETLIGMVEGSDAHRRRALAKAARLGAAGD